MEIESCARTTSENLIIYQAIKDNKLEDVKSLLDDGVDVNAPIWTTGPFAGYTALHVACMGNNDDLVELLVCDYKADVNIVAEDGIQPIHLVCIYESCVLDTFYLSTKKLICLLKANANPNAEIGREMFSKHLKDMEWCPDFDSKMSLVAYTILYRKQYLAECLIKNNANLNITSLTNKTLLMYVIDSYQANVIVHFKKSDKYSSIINQRDNDGMLATHYVFNPIKKRGFWYDVLTCFDQVMFEELFEMGVDINALVNGDPETFLPNMAAYRLNDWVLDFLLPYYDEFMSLSKVLFYVTRPFDKLFGEFIQAHPINDPEEYARSMNELREKRQNCINVTLKDLIIRRTFGLSVNKEEVKLMDNLIANDKDIKVFVNEYEKNFINGELKNKFIEINGKKITFYEFFMQVFDGKKLKLMAKDETLSKWSDVLSHEDFNSDDFGYAYLSIPVDRRIKNAQDRLELLKKLTKISTLRGAIPLPYELILDIVECLSNDDLEIFIDAFRKPLDKISEACHLT